MTRTRRVTDCRPHVSLSCRNGVTAGLSLGSERGGGASPEGGSGIPRASADAVSVALSSTTPSCGPIAASIARPRPAGCGRGAPRAPARPASRRANASRCSSSAAGSSPPRSLLALVVPTERSPSLVAVAALVVAYGLVSRIEFEIGSGSLVPTRARARADAVRAPARRGAARGRGRVGRRLGRRRTRGRIRPERILLRLVDSWHAVGPALVLALGGRSDPTGATGRSTSPRCSRSSFEFASCAAWERFVRESPPCSSGTGAQPAR